MRRLLITAALVCTGAAGCGSNPQTTGCKTDSDCGTTGLFCNTTTHQCQCRTDDACGSGKYCNSHGFCQLSPACIGDADCGSGMICDTSAPNGGTCIPDTQCGTSADCDFGNYCPPRDPNNPDTPRTCTPGCRSTGDCVLGQVCIAGACVAGSCSTCPAQPDPDPDYCDLGQKCTFDGQCQAVSAQLCQPCSSTSPCPTGLTCLIDNEDNTKQYCTSYCQTDADCPNGYNACGSLIITPTGSCTPGPGVTCPNGGGCIPDTEASGGFCECTSDADCGPDISGICQNHLCPWDNLACNADVDCLCDHGTCYGQGSPCTTGSDCVATCVTVGDPGSTYNVCMTSYKVCGKNPGTTCATLTDPSNSLCESL